MQSQTNTVGHLSAPNEITPAREWNNWGETDVLFVLFFLDLLTSFHSLAGVISFGALRCPTLFHSLAGVIAFGALRCPTLFQKNRIFLISFVGR